MRSHLLHPRDQLVTIMERIYHNGMTTLSGGNLSIRDTNGDVWITPAGVDKGALTPKDIMCVQANGRIVGPHRPSSEYPFHRAIYARRPDLRAIVHAHPPALVSFSIMRETPVTDIIPQARRVCGAVGYAPYALPGSEALGESIAATFAQGYNVVLLENHGIAAGGEDLRTAFQRLETLDFCARTLLRARGLGPISRLTEEEIAYFDGRESQLPEFEPTEHSSQERELRKRIAEIVHRACDRYLMISTEGVVSARVDGGGFLITPTGLDRRSIEIEDLVLIREGQREQAKWPSRSVCLHQAIYEAHPEIGAILIAQPPHVMAYAIAAQPFDTRTIPESYILLRDIPLLPYGAQYRDPAKIAAALSRETPAMFVQNDCVLTTGADVLQAFDRLEVAEFSAKSVLDILPLGKLVPIGEDDIEALRTKFMK